MPSPDLTQLLQAWQRILRLQDWNVTVEIVDFLDCMGRTKHDRYKDATIELCSEHTVGPNFIGNRDTEVTLVHELLHLHSAGFDEFIVEDTAEDKALEVMVELSAQALVALRRLGE